MKRKGIHILFLAGLLLAVLCCAAAAGNEDFVIENGILTEYHGSGGDVVIPSGVTRIGPSVFAYNNDLTTVSIPEGVTVIDIGAFMECRNLQSVTLPNGLLEIGISAFQQCEKLSSIYIPDSVARIDQLAFTNCKSLATVRLPATAVCAENSFFGTAWSSDGTIPETVAPAATNQGNLDFTIQDGVLLSYNGAGGDITIPDGVTSIGARVFYQNTSIKSVTVPDSLTIIESSAFEGCTNLKQVSPLPLHFKRIGENAFKGCTSLTTFDLPALAVVEKNAFAGTVYERTNGSPYLLNNAFSSKRSYNDPFRDVAKGAWYYNNVAAVYESGIIDGKSATRFDPNGTITIAEAVKIAATAHATGTGHTDRLVASNPWYQTYADYMARYAAADLSGWKDWSRPIRRDEFAYLLQYALPEAEWTGYWQPTEPFPDLVKHHDGYTEENAYVSAVETLYFAGVCAGAPDGKYYPERTITRGEAAAITARVIFPEQRIQNSK